MRGSALALLAQLPEPTRSPEEVQRRAEEILSRPEFRRPEPSLFDRVQEWVVDQLARVFSALSGGGRGSVVGLVLLVAAIGALVFFATRFARTVSAEPRARPVEARTPVRSAAEWLAEAERCEAAGRWRDGVRYRHRALVASLAERGVVQEVPGRTAGEYRADITSAVPGAARDVAAATDLFDRVCYGDVPTGPDERDRFETLAGRVLEGAVG